MESITTKMRESAERFTIWWRGTTDERAEAQTFINEFFEIFGLHRKDFAQFEKPIKKKTEAGTGFADLFWSGKLIIEAKSSSKDTEKDWAATLKQAVEYIENLLPYQKPQYILLINFKRFQIFSVEKLTDPKKVKITFKKEILIEDLSKQLDEFLFFPELAAQLEDSEEKINSEAARLIANVYDAIERKGYNREEIAIFLARLMFCMFAEDTGIFEQYQFENFLKNNTTSNNLGEKLKNFFEVLNTPTNKRKEYEQALMKFPYVNGGLFKDNLEKLPKINPAFRETLIKCCEYDWSFISPVIFGSLFQAVIHEEDRRSLGAHYTSEKNIMRVARPLFLDELREEFESVKNNKNLLEKFRKKISELRFLDPACGCGNFLVVTYRELRLLDIEIIRLQNHKNLVLDVSILTSVQLTNFFGYEIDNTSAMIAEVAMWLTEHQMNMRLENEFGKTIPTIPLKEAANIKKCNALTTEWTTNIEGKYFDYILGNPPFVGQQLQNSNQKEDMNSVFFNVDGSGVLDYVTAWYLKAAKYMQDKKIKVAFVSTNSISQGEQVGILWNELFYNYKIKIHFAHRTFKWSNEAKGNAAVYCVIIGFTTLDIKSKIIFEYEDIKGEPNKKVVTNINPYLFEGKDFALQSLSKPLSKVLEIKRGNSPYDGGNFLLDQIEYEEFLHKEPNANKFIKKFLGAREFINGENKYCIWLKEARPEEIKTLPHIVERVKKVKEFREKSPGKETQSYAATPTLFRDKNNPDTFIVIPRVSSENRKYIPMGFFDKSYIAGDTCMTIFDAKLFHFGILNSEMHMAWVKSVCGRLKSDFRYSKDIVYNNYPWPENPNESQINKIETAAQKVLDARLEFPESSLADLYDPLTMPIVLQNAHKELDKAVDLAYRPQPFPSEAKRMEFLFDLYEKYTADLFTKEKVKKKKK